MKVVFVRDGFRFLGIDLHKPADRTYTGNSLAEAIGNYVIANPEKFSGIDIKMISESELRKRIDGPFPWQ